MTKEEIMKMDDRELYERLLTFIYSRPPALEVTISLCVEALRDSLYYCYQAEEKVKEMGLKEKYWCWLDDVIDNAHRPIGDQGIFPLVHAHPRDRARAILLTIKEKESYD